MRWDNEPYQKIKQDIFDMLENRLNEKDAEKITVKNVFDAIDEMFRKLIKEGDK